MEGNQQKMREALVKIEKMSHCDLCNVYPKYRDKFNDMIGGIEREARTALSKPPRNCDVGTSEERMYRYNRLRDEINERYKRLGEIPPSFAFPTAFEWEDRPYEADEGTGE